MSFTSHDIQGFDYVHHWVGNAKHSAHYYAQLFGFRIVAYMGPETGVRDRVSYILKQNDLTFVITAGREPQSPIWDFIRQHGDGVKEISVRVKDVEEALHHARDKGASVIAEPERITDEHGTFRRATIAIYGDTHFSLVNREQYQGLLPGYQTYEGPQFAKGNAGLIAVDHIVGNVGEGEMNKWATFFEEALDLETFVHFDKGDISTQFSALLSKVVRSKNSAVKFPINEPAEGLKKSQIEEYLDEYRGSGVQHVAIETRDMIKTIAYLTEQGLSFIPIPQTYYDVIADRIEIIDEDVAMIKKLNILVDKEGDGYLLQLFTQPLNDRPTLFFEIIQRKGSEGFGQNNFQSLFESIEQEQAKRGNL